MTERTGKMTASVMAQKCGLYLKEATEDEINLIKSALGTRNDTKRVLKVFQFFLNQENPQADYQKMFHNAVDKLTKNSANAELRDLVDDLIQRADTTIQGKSLKTYTQGSEPSTDEVANSLQNEGKLYWPIQLPNEDKPRIFEYAEIDHSEIDTKTEIVEIHNSRFQGQAERIRHLAGLIKQVGQSQPAFAYWPEEQEKASVLDGSRRRAGCKLAEKDFRMFFTREALTEDQIEFLASIFESAEKLSYPEKATRFSKRYFAAKKKASAKGEKLSINQYAKTQTTHKKSHVYNVVDHGCVDSALYEVFPNLDLLSQNWCNTQLLPLIMKVIDSDLIDISHEDTGDSSSDQDDLGKKPQQIKRSSQFIRTYLEEYKAKVDPEDDAWEDTFHTLALKYVEAECFAGEMPKETKKRVTPELAFVAGSSTKSKNWIRQTRIEKDSPYQASVKIDDPDVQLAFSKMLETFVKEHNL